MSTKVTSTWLPLTCEDVCHPLLLIAGVPVCTSIHHQSGRCRLVGLLAFALRLSISVFFGLIFTSASTSASSAHRPRLFFQHSPAHFFHRLDSIWSVLLCILGNWIAGAVSVSPRARLVDYRVYYIEDDSIIMGLHCYDGVF